MNRLLSFLFVPLLLCALSLQVSAQSVGGTTSGSASYCAGNNSGFISLTGFNGTIVQWESSENLTVWTPIPNPTATQSYLNLLVTTHYRVIVQDGANPPDTSTISTITIFDPAAGGTIAGGGTFCDQSGPGTLNLTGVTGTVQYWLISTDNGVTWNQIANTSTALNYTSITQNTVYAAVVENVAGCPLDTSSLATFTIDDLSVAGTLSADDTVCEAGNGDTLFLSGTTGTILDWETSTDNGATWVSTGNTSSNTLYSNLTQTTSYRAFAVSGVCPIDTSNTVEIVVIPPPAVDAGQAVEIVNHQSTTLNGSGSANPFWSPTEGLDDPNTFTPVASPNSTTLYTLTVVDQWGCTSSDTVSILVEVPIPSAITPNGDAVNDFFIIDKIENLPSNTLTIFNRQGNVVYEASPYTNNWDGRGKNGAELPDGIYYYVFDLGQGETPLNGFVLIKLSLIHI